MDRKRVNRYAVLWIKYLPIAAVVCCILNTMGSFFGFNFEAVGYLFNILVFIGLILLSYVLQFCAWHRCLIWYVLGCQLLNAFDYYIGIPERVSPSRSGTQASSASPSGQDASGDSA